MKIFVKGVNNTLVQVNNNSIQLAKNAIVSEKNLTEIEDVILNEVGFNGKGNLMVIIKGMTKPFEIAYDQSQKMEFEKLHDYLKYFLCNGYLPDEYMKKIIALEKKKDQAKIETSNNEEKSYVNRNVYISECLSSTNNVEKLFCSQCGTECSSEASFCHKCGSKLVREIIAKEKTPLKNNLSSIRSVKEISEKANISMNETKRTSIEINKNCCPNCGSANYDIIDATKYKTTMNLNPLKPFTLTNTKEIKKKKKKLSLGKIALGVATGGTSVLATGVNKKVGVDCRCRNCGNEWAKK